MGERRARIRPNRWDQLDEYVKERKIFGQALADFQNTQFTLADIKTNLDVGWAFLDQCIKKCSDGTLTPEEGAMAKLWTTENEGVPAGLFQIPVQASRQVPDRADNL